VNILKDVTGRRRIGYDEVMEVCTREHFDRFLVGTIKKRITGLEAVEDIQKLVVLGKPGAGKTTFMKYLAMSCLGDKFHGELVPIFVTLKVYAETKGAPTLQEYIFAELQQRKVSQDAVERLLDEGKALILLDGLDEVKKEDDRRVKQDIDKFSRDWLKNRFAITCRIAAREYQFERFTEVEVADFDDEQIATFVNNWFREKDPSKAERLIKKLQGNEPVKELAKTPLLLTLLCWVFEDKNDLPKRQSELYKEGLNFLLKKWDEIRYVDRDIAGHFRGEQIYKNLSSEDKLDILGRIAFEYFTKSGYFFEQEDLQCQIKNYICNLTEASADPNVLRLDSEGVLKAIEHHHGLLVERARNIYSFSHLTFQEYFTAREIERKQQLEILVQNITDPRWKEVFYLTAEMLRRSDVFLRLMKEQIDGMLTKDEELQAFLEWSNQKTNSVEFNYNAASVRAFYAYSAFLPLNVFYDVDMVRELAYAADTRMTYDLSRSADHNCSLSLDLLLDLELVRCISDKKMIFLNPVIEYRISIANNHKQLLQLLNQLEFLDVKLPVDRLEFNKWSDYYKDPWIHELRQVCIDRRNIGHDWQFTKEQVELLNQYYTANLLLVECMNRSYVSKEVREEIESTLLLPVGAISN
jgi:predicted NACHT family NTPase